MDKPSVPFLLLRILVRTIQPNITRHDAALWARFVQIQL